MATTVNAQPACSARIMASVIGLLSMVESSNAGPTFSIVYSFDGLSTGGPPVTGLMQTDDGQLFGATAGNFAGDPMAGIFRVMPGGIVKRIPSTDGVSLTYAPTQGYDKALYGVSISEGEYSAGALHRVGKNGSYLQIYSFGQTSTAPKIPNSPLLLSSRGTYFGSTLSGGVYSSGTLYSISKKGNLATLVHSFMGPEGCRPSGNLVEVPDGTIYGTATGCGPSPRSGGTIFSLGLDGDVRAEYSFIEKSGSEPTGGLILARDGSLVGTTYNGGPQGSGVIYRFAPGGGYTTLQSPGGGSLYFATSLIQARDGNFYGFLTNFATLQGVMYRMTEDGTRLDYFPPLGEVVFSPLMQASDGYLYGTSVSGGQFGYGTIFRYGPIDDVPVARKGPVGHQSLLRQQRVERPVDRSGSAVTH